LAGTLGGKFKILVHRDRDSLTDEEAARLMAQYEAEGVEMWLPVESDVEAYFCSRGFLEIFLGCTSQQAAAYVDTAIERNLQPIAEQFKKQRVAHNDKELYPEGGSPINDVVWAAFQARPLKGAKGKTIFRSLKDQLSASVFSEEKLLLATLNGQVALDLKHKIETILAG
jgi:hypothetical protein